MGLSTSDRVALVASLAFAAAAVGTRVVCILARAQKIDGYAPWTPSAGERLEPQPGVERFRDFVLVHYGGRSVGIMADESHPPTSLHIEGRAWDWAPDRPEHAAVLLSDLLATDLAGNREAGARRVGLAQIIHGTRIWVAGRGWQPYQGPSHPHVHFGFGWPGAEARTSWFG